MTKDEVMRALRSTSDFRSTMVRTVMHANWLHATMKKSHCQELNPHHLEI